MRATFFFCMYPSQPYFTYLLESASLIAGNDSCQAQWSLLSSNTNVFPALAIGNKESSIQFGWCTIKNRKKCNPLKLKWLSGWRGCGVTRRHRSEGGGGSMYCLMASNHFVGTLFKFGRLWESLLSFIATALSALLVMPEWGVGSLCWIAVRKQQIKHLQCNKTRKTQPNREWMISTYCSRKRN